MTDDICINLGFIISFLYLYYFGSRLLLFVTISISLIIHITYFLFYYRYLSFVKEQNKIEKENILLSILHPHKLKDKEEQICNICYDPFFDMGGHDDDDDVYKLECNCKYYYHQDCIKNWFKNGKASCPFCRKEFSF